MSFNSHNFVNFHPSEKNKILKSKLGHPLSSTRNIPEIEQKAFVPLLIKRRKFLGHPVECTFVNSTHSLAKRTKASKLYLIILCQKNGSFQIEECELRHLYHVGFRNNDELF